MQTFIHDIIIQNPIGNLYRKNHVLILLKTSEGNLVLGQKQGFYPEGISRMFGWGIDEGEEPIRAAKREILEETQIDLPMENFTPLCKVITQATTLEWDMTMNTYIYSALIDAEHIRPSDDVDGISTLDKESFKEMVSTMYNLSGTYETEKFCFDWGDWGKIYGYIHEKTYECFYK